ncbi:MAG: type III pantothenate kinase [Candidatus Omnitrophota bacterium]|jgi:type III pantothenate kinase
MLLTADIGNTNINLGVFKGKKLLKRFIIPTQKPGYAKQLSGIFKSYPIKKAIICSVVPTSTVKLQKAINQFLNTQPVILGRDYIVPITNLYHDTQQVGQDRLVNAYAGIMLYGAPLVVIDYGTAITFDVISKRKEYLGGMIIPGLRISLEVLKNKTALLPRIQLEKPRAFIGKDTKNSMLSGIVYGFACLTDNLTERIKAKIGKNSRVIATGGNIAFIRPYCTKIDKVDPDLTLKGLYLLYQEYSQQIHSKKFT